MSGIFDWFKKISPPPLPGARSQLPILRESMLPAAPREAEKKMSIFDIFKSKPKEVSRGLIKSPEFFGVLTPAAPPEAPKKKEQEKSLWEAMFPEAPKEEERPARELFEILKPSAIYEAQKYTNPSEWPFGEPPLWEDTRWQMPTTYELAEMIHQKWDLPGIYEFVLSTITTPWWKRQVAESSHTGEPAAIDINLITKAEPPYNDMGTFLNIPDYVIEQYGRHGQAGLERFTVEVLQPMLERVGKALDVFRPTPELRGWFELEPDQDMNFWLRYKEARFRPQLG
jgi:hypothetical protein